MYISDIFKNNTGRILESGGHFDHCRPVWAEPWKFMNTLPAYWKLLIFELTGIIATAVKQFANNTRYGRTYSQKWNNDGLL